MSEIQTLDEFKAYLEAKVKADAEAGNGEDPAPPDTIRLALQAAVCAESLTGDKHWDYYLQCMQGAVEQTREAESAQLERLADPLLVDRDTILRLKMSLASLQATALALEWAIELPQQIKATGNIAKGLETISPSIPT